MKRGLTWLWRLGQLVIVLAVVYGIYRLLVPDLRTLDWAAVAALRPNFVRLVFSLVLLVGVYLAHAFLWRAIMRDLGMARPDPRTTLRVYFVASLGRYVPGKLWQLAGFAVLAARAGMSATGATAAALLGQFAFLATGLLFVAVVLPEWAGTVPARILGAILVVIAGSIWIVTATPAGRQARDWITSRAGGKAGEQLRNTFEFAERVRGRDAIRWGVGYGLSWVLLGLAFSVFVTAFVPEAAAASSQLAGTVAAAYLAGYLVMIAPAGLGVREGALATLLAAIPDVSVGTALVITVLSRVWFTIGEILPLALVPVVPGNAAPGPREPVKEPEADTT